MISIPKRLQPFTNTDLHLTKETSLGLDLIRGISAQMVLVGLALSYYHIYPSLKDKQVFYIQNLGVLIFFILSGFLITLTTRRKAFNNPSTYSFGGFFMDRFVRIFSAFIPALVFIAVVDGIAIRIFPAGYPYEEAFNLKTAVANIFMLQDFPALNNLLPEALTITSFGSGRPFWTVAIEWWFYMFFGWLFFFRKNTLNTVLKILILLFFAIVPLLNVRGGRGNCLTYLWYACFVLSYLYNSPFVKRLGKTTVTGALVLICLVFTGLIGKYELKVYNYQIGAVVTIFLFILIVLFPKIPSLFSNERINRYIRLTADFSFSLYLIHYTILSFLCESVGFYKDKPWIGFFASFVICNIAAYVFARCTEFRHKQLRSWVFKKYGI